jgi:cyclopropane fatty-acyl-phospholipid synthase-like methyltransferase
MSAASVGSGKSQAPARSEPAAAGNKGVHLSARQDVIAYYEGKTRAIVERYGPGPRVHYHTGIIDDPRPPGSSIPELRQSLVTAQERLLHYAAERWDASSALCGDVLDVGCGLGGGAIFWAQEFGARVTAVTCVASHIEWVARFAARAGVEARVRPLLCDALEVAGENRFDGAVAVDSSGYLPRRPWLRRIAALLRPGGRAFLVDCFLERSEYEEPFNRYWRTRIGKIEEYLEAADDAGLHLVAVEDVTRRTEHFWTTTIALIEAELRANTLNASEAAQREASLAAHRLVRRGLAEHGLRYALMSFGKNGGSGAPQTSGLK